MDENHLAYLSGKKLYGDDFTIDQIKLWYEDEAEGYANLGAKKKGRYIYVYHQLNKRHAYRFIKGIHFEEVLGMGSAYGDEFKPIINNIGRLTILEPSKAFSASEQVFGVPCKYIKPDPGGKMPFKDKAFNLVSCLGVMHHIPNVSYVMGECFRYLGDGGFMILREPVTSMGDWRKKRPRMTKNERGIPLKIIDSIVKSVGFEVKYRALCVFPIIPRLSKRLGVAAYNSAVLTIADALISRMLFWNVKYHRTKLHEKFAPASVYYLLEKNP